MNASTLVSRGLRFYRRTHLGVLAGCAVSAAVLVGALFVGDSVRGTLRGIALARLGAVDVALDTGNRFFRDDLPNRMRVGGSVMLRVPGMAIRESTQVNRVEVMGVDGHFLPLAQGQVAIGERLASALGAKVGDEIALRVYKPGLFSREAPLASGKKDDRDTRRRPFTVARVLGDAELGRFSLKSDQSAPLNAYVPLDDLQQILDLPGRANRLLARGGDEEARIALLGAWTLEDAGLSVRSTDGVLQLQSERIYLDPAAGDAALRLDPNAVGSLAYLVNSITSEKGTSTPYSFVTALTPGRDPTLGPVPLDMKDDEILVNRWVADQLSIREGDRVKTAYSEFTAGNEFVEKERAFRVRGVIEMDALAREKALVPEFPGLTNVESCRDWKVGLPMDERKLKDEANEAYWKKYRQTPKAFVTLAAGRAMWANRYGDLMTVRFARAARTPESLAASIRSTIDPTRLGLLFRPVRKEAERAAGESMDLGQLFLGMSLFLIAASLVLTGMLFVFAAEQRAGEMGVLLATGFTPGRVRRLFLAEGAVLALAGSILGLPLGWGFAKALLWGLGGAWKGAVAEAPVEFHASIASALVGMLAAAAISLLAMAVALRRQVKRPVKELVAEDFSLASEARAPSKGSACVRRAIFIGAATAAACVVGWTLASKASNPAGSFFAAGSFLLVAGLALLRHALASLSTRATARPSIGELGVRNASRRPGRSLATAGMLAAGCFVVLSVSAFTQDLSRQAGERRSGTGGFRLFGESSVALTEEPKGVEGVSIVPLRAREGDDASCLNLNQSLVPPLVGVDPLRLARLGAFADPELWALLDRDLPDGAVPAIVGDSATAVWKLRKKVGMDGDLLDYRDERGVAFKVKLVGALPERLSVLQGRLLISQRHFTRLYPSEGGYRIFLIDVPAGDEERARRRLSERMETVGLDIVPSVDRLKEFYAVESAYLRMFLVLGGLGLLLGSAGMGILVLRQVLERRSELALLRAVGFTKSQAARVVAAEHRFLLLAGLAVGVVASAMAVAPAVVQPSVRLPYAWLGIFLAGTAVLSLLWIRLAARVALRSSLVPALRRE